MGQAEQIILDAINDEKPGFRGGVVSAEAASNELLINHKKLQTNALSCSNSDLI